MMPLRENTYSNCWLSAVQLSAEAPVGPLDVIEALEKDDVESRPVWKPMHLQPVFAGCAYVTREEGVDVGKDIFERGLCLPSDIKMSGQVQDEVIEIIRSCF